MKTLYNWFAVTILILLTTQCTPTGIAPAVKRTPAVIPDCNKIAPPGTGLIDEIICAHNAVRTAVKPAAATPLPPLKWDKNLAKVAQAYAKQCRFAHNPDRDNAGQGLLGENLFITTSTTPPAYAAVETWASEVKIYNYQAGTCQGRRDFSGCGHYTQMVWRETTAVGCGVAFCPVIKGRKATYSNATILVCNYSPPGNFIGKKPY